MLEELWDSICDGFDYFIHFEWVSDVREFFGSMFENITELSTYGIVFGLITVVVMLFIGKWTITPFIVNYKPIAKIIWTVLTYVILFIGGYFMGKHFENTG